MKKITKTLLAVLLAGAMLLPTTAMAAVYNDNNEIVIRVGLASSSKHNEIGQLAGAHLENAAEFGKGYRFGYYDEGLNFQELGRTDAETTKIAVLKTQNLCYGYDADQERTTYSPTVDSDIKVGCFHIQLPESHTSFENAAAAAAEYGGYVAWIDGEYWVRIGSWFTKEAAQGHLDQFGQGSIVGTSAYGMSVVKTGTNQIIFQYDAGEGSSLAVLPDVTDAGDVQTWFRGFKYRGGFTYQRIAGGSLTVVNVLPLEDYVRGVAPYEMGREWPLEALKTQATCARTYAMINLNKHRDLGFDVCNSSWCQVYYGTGSSRPDHGPTAVSDQAVEETANQVVWYGQDMAETYYSSSHGGASESIANVWGSKLEKYPYLCGVDDPYEAGAADINANSSWQVTYSSSQLLQKLQNSGYGVGTKIDSMELTYSERGNVIKAVVRWTNGGSNTFKPDAIRSCFGLKSIRFTVNGAQVEQDIPDQPQTDVNTFTLNGNDLLAFGPQFRDEVYVITGRGNTAAIAQKPYIIEGDGDKSVLLTEVEEPELPTASVAGTVTVSGGEYVFHGSGWGHQLGMSQFGANAMAKQGFTFDKIIEHYFPGTHVADYHD